MTWEKVQNLAAAYIPESERQVPDMLEEARGIAEGGGVDFIDIMALNCRYEILHYPLQPECTAYALQREATADGHVYIGQNWDNRPYLLPHTLLLHITEEETGNIIFGLTEAGQLIRNGFNNKGVGQCANSLRATLDKQGSGVPSTFVRRQLLRHDNMDDMVKLIRTASRSVSVNYCLASCENKVGDVEAVPGQPVLFSPVDGIITHANHLLVNRDLVHQASAVSGESACTSCFLQKKAILRGSISESASAIMRVTLKESVLMSVRKARFGRRTRP